MSAEELAKDIHYQHALTTTWRPPRWTDRCPALRHDRVRAKYNMQVEGERVPPPLGSFGDMKLHPIVQERLRKRGICKPSAIQVQGERGG
jgi:ATP-dependent RNA helicase DDX41